jgi:hypothetical protein
MIVYFRGVTVNLRYLRYAGYITSGKYFSISFESGLNFQFTNLTEEKGSSYEKEFWELVQARQKELDLMSRHTNNPLIMTEQEFDFLKTSS